MTSGQMPTASEILDLLDRLQRDPSRRGALRMSTEILRACVAEGLLELDGMDWLARLMQELDSEDLIAHGSVSGGVFEPSVWNDYWLQSVHDWRVTARGRADAALYQRRRAEQPRQRDSISASPEQQREPHDHDVFISHASEDKDAIARPLAHALQARGWTIWMDELELTIGDSLSGRIDAALARSRFGVVILSPAFFSKEWPQRELAGLAAREVAAGSKVILPVWHEVDRAFIVKRSPVLADRLGALSSAGVEDVAAKITAALQRASNREPDADSQQPVLQAVASNAASELGLALGVPASQEERTRLLVSKPPGWENLLFAGVLLQGKNALETKWHDHELLIPSGTRREFESGTAVLDYLRREVRWVASQLEARMRVFDPSTQERAWGAPGEPGDPPLIEHFARHILATYEVLMDWAASVRNTSIPENWAEVIELTASMVNEPIDQVREFIDRVVEEMARVPELIAAHRDGDPPYVIHLMLELSIDARAANAATSAMQSAVAADAGD